MAQRFGNPFRVAEAYKAKLLNWPQIVEGDSSSLQDFSDFLIRCEGAMQSMKYMEELNSTRLLQEISTKLPLKLGSRWCLQARDVLKKTVSWNLSETEKQISQMIQSFLLKL